MTFFFLQKYMDSIDFIAGKLKNEPHGLGVFAECLFSLSVLVWSGKLLYEVFWMTRKFQGALALVSKYLE